MSTEPTKEDLQQEINSLKYRLETMNEQLIEAGLKKVPCIMDQIIEEEDYTIRAIERLIKDCERKTGREIILCKIDCNETEDTCDNCSNIICSRCLRKDKRISSALKDYKLQELKDSPLKFMLSYYPRQQGKSYLHAMNYGMSYDRFKKLYQCDWSSKP